MSEITVPIKALKNLLGKEIDSHYSEACQSIHHNVQRGFIHLGYRLIKDRLAIAESYDDLDEILSDMDYRMSIQEWVNSL